MKWLLPLLLAVFASRAYAEVRIAFIEIRDAKGKLVQLEKGGRFAHLALSYRGQWLHSVPYYGVVLVSTERLAKIGKIAEIVVRDDLHEPTASEIERFLGRHYDHEFSWADDEAVYCSELVGKLLELTPEPMVFDPELWPEKYLRLNGHPGLSPDDVYRLVRARESE